MYYYTCPCCERTKKCYIFFFKGVLNEKILSQHYALKYFPDDKHTTKCENICEYLFNVLCSQ